MNTIPLIFNERKINTTIAGGDILPSDVKIDIGVVLLNSKESYFRSQTLENLVQCGFSSIISIEPFSRNFNIEESVKKFPSVKFIFLLEEATEGDMINIGIGESSSSYVFVLRDTLNITSNFFPSYVADKIIHSDDFCIVPRLLNKNGESIPINFFPTQEKGHFRVRFSNHLGDGTKTLYPFDFIGLYNRKKFIQLGGFDYTILSPYYQNLDLSIRSYLWGEKIKTTTTFMISYQDEVPIEDITLDLSYLHFYLKNMMPHYKVDEGCYVPRFAFLSFLKKSPCGIFESQKIFSDGKRWIEKNRLRFQTDLYNLIEMWE